MNCRNCGMPVTGNKCEYCGTDYSILNAEIHEPIIYASNIGNPDELKRIYDEISRGETLVLTSSDDMRIIRYVDGQTRTICL